MRRSTLLLVPMLAAAALVGVVALAGAGNAPKSLFERVAANPEQFIGSEVRVSGRIAAPPTRSELSIIENADGQRLLVSAPADIYLPVGVRVAVRGRVQMRVDELAASVGTTALVRVREVAARPG